MLKVILVIFSFIIYSESKIYLNSVVTNRDLKRSNLSSVVFDDFFINTTFTVFSNFSKLLLTFTFSIPKDERDKNYDFTLIHYTIQSCKISQGSRANFIVKMLMDGNDFAQIFKCPMLAGTYGFYNFKPNDKFLPQVLLGKNRIRFQLLVKVDAKILNSKNASVWLFTFKIQGEIKNS
ncbi:hypothetical protein PVAND_005956 [Polypedilum vanderplanki]|uniref:Uncharacterized protein n=1 Tax=Polypedilum vanderplanki TaxID=319348 RepID=A0A9J6C3J5_POLVA|nr:hypothetical protein PVAND_005956 [Polypedilum vanderplanki]